MNGDVVRAARMGISFMSPGSAGLLDRVHLRGPVDVWEEEVATNSQRYGKLDLDQVQRSAAHHGIRFIIPGDDEWPTGLAQLAGVDNGNGCGGVPAGLWVKGGGHLGALSRHSVAIFGSRAATAYGEHATAKFSAEISEAGVLVVSGGAFGIDAAAHRAALAVAAPTAAVLGCGLDMAYPPSNGKLFDRIAEQGVLVSEVPPGTHPTRALFLSRNRLIPAVSQASVIVEAAGRSGAMNQAEWARLLKRVLLAVPGPITSHTSVGPHTLISEGKAVLVSEPRQVLSLIAQHGEGSVTFQAAPQDYRNAVNLRDPALYMPNFSRQAALDERGQAYSNQLTHPRSQQLAAEIKGGVQR